jgi:hypothetical protein
MLDFTIKRADGTPFPVPVYGLVDSGADGTMFPLDAMGPLGIALGDCDEKDQMGASGAGKFYEWKGGTLEGDFGGITINLLAQFSETPFILLGRSDFFARFAVMFEQRRLRFILEPN